MTYLNLRSLKLKKKKSIEKEALLSSLPASRLVYPLLTLDSSFGRI